jgi:AraC-like DNA-binding protein
MARRETPRDGGTRLPYPRARVTIERIIAGLDERVLHEAPSLDELAAMAAMGRFRFSRLFNAVAGMSMRSYIRTVRVKRASELLATTALPLTVVAVECGFYDVSHFARTFRQEVGISPREFRRRQPRGRSPSSPSPSVRTPGFRRRARRRGYDRCCAGDG